MKTTNIENANEIKASRYKRTSDNDERQFVIRFRLTAVFLIRQFAI